MINIPHKNRGAYDTEWCYEHEKLKEDCGECLSRCESFTQYLDQRGDSLPLPVDMEDWLSRTSDTIC